MLNRHYVVAVLIAALCAFGRPMMAQVPFPQPAAATQPAAKPENDLPTTLAQVLTLSMQGNKVVADIHWKPSQREGTTLRLQDIPGDTLVQNLLLMGLDGGGNQDYFAISNHRQDGNNTSYLGITIQAQSIYISQTTTTMGNGGFVSQEVVTLSFNQGFGLSRTKVVNNKMEPQTNICEPTWGGFLDKHPDDVDEYARPLLESLHLETLLPTHDVWAYQVLADQLKPTPDVDAQVKKLIGQLDDPSPEKRDEALEKLKTLGNPALAVLVRLDRSQLTPEQADRLGAISRDGFLEDKRVTAFKTDKKFLLDCLRSGDEAIRRAATEQLQTVLGQKLDFDAAGTAAQRGEQIGKLRQQLFPSTRPAATKPT